MYLSIWPALVLLFCTFHPTTAGGNSLCIEHRLDQSLEIQHAIRTCSTTVSRSSPRKSRRGTKLDMFRVDLQCLSADSKECNLVKEAFDTAAWIISSIIHFNAPVVVNATYLSFCEAFGDCGRDRQSVNTGQAYPAVSYLMREHPTNRTRMYPQALLKQFTNLPRQVQWTRYDMNAQFNSEQNWYFQSYGDINDDQNDFLCTVTHEFIHGLGFVSAWSDQLYQEFVAYDENISHFLTPMPFIIPNALADIYNNTQSGKGPQPFWGFIDFPLDRMLWVPNENRTLSSMNDVLNTWGESNVMFASMVDMVNSFEGSGAVWDTAQKVYSYATTAWAIAIYLGNDLPFWVETSLVPFAKGSTLSHVDHAAYNLSSDFLMMYNTRRGVTLKELTDNDYNATIGPILRQTLALLGYNLTGLIPLQPMLTFWLPEENLVGTPSNLSPAVSSQASGPAHIPITTATTSLSPILTAMLPHHFLLTLLSSSFICTPLVIFHSVHLI